MDKLSIFPKGDEVSKVSLTTEEGNTLDTVVEGLENVRKQLEATHLGHEEEDWDKEFPVEEE